MKVRVVNIHGDKSRLVTMAESIGSTLGLLAAKVNAVHDITPNSRAASKRRRSKRTSKAGKSRRNAQAASSSTPSPRKATTKTRRGTTSSAGRRARAAPARSSSNQK
jgi:hypothetical protein